ncbi:hypothetical protein ACHAXT_005431 [Thalassiosira profunda]
MDKRRRHREEDSDDDGSDGSSSHEHDASDASSGGPSDLAGRADDARDRPEPFNNDNSGDNIAAEAASSTAEPQPKKKKVRKLKLSATEDFNAKLRKRGIVYLSRVPPRMGPAKVKSLLSDFGPVSRIYLVEEDKTARKRRKKAGGSGGKRYTEGWAEFESKKDAKLVGESLNMTRVTNHKGSIHYDDLWNVKYLRGFKWSHLTEKVAYERRVREQKLRVEMMEVRRENASYAAQVEAGRKLDYIEERRRKKGKSSVAEEGGAEKKKRKVRQKKPFEGDGRVAKSAILGSLV